MLFAQFYQRSALDPAVVIEGSGDRSVIVYDARLRLADVIADARAECARRGYVGVALFKGDTFTRSRRISPVEPLTN